MSREPIVLDEYGALLIPRAEEQTTWVSDYLGIHDGCFAGSQIGSLLIRLHSRTHHSIYCSGCHLRIIIPNTDLTRFVCRQTDETFDKLRQYCSAKIKAQQVQREQDYTQRLWNTPMF